MEFKLANFEIKEVIPKSSFGEDYIDWGLKTVGAEIAWKKATGKNVKVAVLDTGIDPNHQDLTDNLKEHADFTGSPQGSIDIKGHGSHCAGIVGGVKNNVGMIGIAPDVELYSAKVLNDNGTGNFEATLKGLQWALDHEVNVISMSFGSASRPPQILHDTIKQIHSKGIIMVAATGNENKQVHFPAAYDEVIAVSAVNEKKERASFSNYGVQNEICAPGVNIVSCYKNGTYARLSGTSMATPIIAGACALIIDRHKQIFFNLKPCIQKTHQFLMSMVRDLGPEGKDELYGMGILDLTKLP